MDSQVLSAPAATSPLPPPTPNRLHAAALGLGSGKPLLLFVHGFPQDWTCWRNQIKASVLVGGCCRSAS